MEADDRVPWKPLLPILLGRLSDAITWCFCFSFLPSMFTSFGLSAPHVALYTGLAESLMICVEAGIALPVAKLSDRIGRRPILLTGLATLSISTSCLGFSTSVWQVLASRILMGLNGTLVTRVMCMEITNPRNRTQTFAIFGPFFSVGLSVGNAIGGYLALPAGRIPLLGSMTLFQVYPYLLPCLVTASIPLISIPITLRYLPETLKRENPSSTASSSRLQKQPSALDAMRQPGIAMLLFAFTVYQVIESASMAALTLTLTMPVDKEGFGFAVSTAGSVLLGQALFYLSVVPFLVPFLVRKLGTKRAIILLMCAWPVVALQFPLGTYLARRGSVLLVVLVCTIVCTRDIGCGPWPLFDTLTADLVKPELLAITNALSMIFGSLGRMTGPSAFGAIYGRSLLADPGSIGRMAVWICFLAAAMTPVMAASVLDQTPAGSDKLESEERRRLIVEEEALDC